MSTVSLLSVDISRVRLGENIRWGEGKKNKYKILEERLIEKKFTRKENKLDLQLTLGDILAVYRNLRENYEFRLKYDDAGQFFIREIEVKRKYKETLSKEGDIKGIELNNWIIRHFSLTGLYYHISRYGQGLLRPILLSSGIILLSFVLWSTQANPLNDYSFSSIIGFSEIDNSTHLEKALARSITNFLPLLPTGTDTQVGLVDFAFKIIGGAVTFGLIIIALRRKFERKFRH